MLRLNLNERADFLPAWLGNFQFTTDSLWQYPNNSVYEKKLADFYHVTAEQVLLTNGADEAIKLLFHYAQKSQRRMIIPLPMFSQYDASLQLFNVQTKLIAPLPSMHIDLDACIETLKQDDILILTTPNNPTGERLSPQQVFDLAQTVEKVGAMLVIDEAYNDFSNDSKTYLPLLQSTGNLLLLRTFSKAYGIAGARLGYAMGTLHCVNNLRALSMPFNVSALALQLLEPCLSTEVQQEVKAYCQTIADNRTRLEKLLTQQGYQVFAGQANFVFFHGEQTQQLHAYLLTKYIAIKANFVGLGTDNHHNQWGRITIPYYIQPLITAIEEFSKEVQL
ncbi:MAG: histidinol-phosphate aminotransferase family protein [Gammaproteobacteria bacterium]|nr:histidinol-phosphate aminotransferase family protein [Gammaproteobacteria bacterium]MBS9778654.1 histidinol-phosphate aminotransferase family protein [Gammaproteobacteria bacterium]